MHDHHLNIAAFAAARKLRAQILALLGTAKPALDKAAKLKAQMLKLCRAGGVDAGFWDTEERRVFDLPESGTC